MLCLYTSVLDHQARNPLRGFGALSESVAVARRLARPQRLARSGITGALCTILTAAGDAAFDLVDKERSYGDI